MIRRKPSSDFLLFWILDSDSWILHLFESEAAGD
jgi:hypothetical protein